MSAPSNTDVGYTPELRDIVWAQMKPWKPWPGQVMNPPKNDKIPESKKNSFYVYFFGSENFGWITRDKIWPYEKFKEKYCQNYKRKDFLSGVETADEKCEARKKGEVSSSSEDEGENEKKEEKEKNDKQEEVIPGESSSSAGSEVFPLTSSPSTSAGQVPKKRKASAIKPKKDSFAESPAKKACLSDISSVFKLAEESPSRMKTFESGGHSILKRHKVGVLGLGVLGSEITQSLLQVGHDVTVWNRTESKVESGAKKGDSPGEIFRSCDITLVCVNSVEAVKYLVFMADGLNSTADKGCNLVVLTMMSPESSVDIEEVIVKKNGRYLEAPIYRIDDGERCSLTVLAAGDESLFRDYESVFKSFAKKCIFLGSTGMASKTALVLHSFMGSMVAGVAEAMCLAERTGVSQDELLHVMSVSPLGCKFLLDKGRAMRDKDFSSRMPLQQVTEAMRDTLNMSTRYRHSMPVGASATEMFVAASALNLGERDMSAVYLPARY